ncbi:hypothetical protein DMH02_024810 [Streptomyces sp. WAC 00631]|uniref:hypothetical protein n=1 Tax=Streptomyces sp. WAC 00631 TaxID=2203201 RepID=UPI000F77D2B8|nr:hypothetical protein [Streptomyces sp. WAC 00631]MCC5036319.1 hypothetical protein [Streptomyces sp. WAC 00631]
MRTILEWLVAIFLPPRGKRRARQAQQRPGTRPVVPLPAPESLVREEIELVCPYALACVRATAGADYAEVEA